MKRKIVIFIMLMFATSQANADSTLAVTDSLIVKINSLLSTIDSKDGSVSNFDTNAVVPLATKLFADTFAVEIKKQLNEKCANIKKDTILLMPDSTYSQIKNNVFAYNKIARLIKVASDLTLKTKEDFNLSSTNGANKSLAVAGELGVALASTAVNLIKLLKSDMVLSSTNNKNNPLLEYALMQGVDINFVSVNDVYPSDSNVDSVVNTIEMIILSKNIMQAHMDYIKSEGKKMTIEQIADTIALSSTISKIDVVLKSLDDVGILNVAKAIQLEMLLKKYSRLSVSSRYTITSILKKHSFTEDETLYSTSGYAIWHLSSAEGRSYIGMVSKKIETKSMKF